MSTDKSGQFFAENQSQRRQIAILAQQAEALAKALETLIHYSQAARECLTQTHLKELLGDASAPLEQAKEILTAYRSTKGSTS